MKSQFESPALRRTRNGSEPPSSLIKSVASDCCAVSPDPFQLISMGSCWPGESTKGASTATLSSYPLERSEEHTSELQSRGHLVCRLLLEKKKNKKER